MRENTQEYTRKKKIEREREREKRKKKCEKKSREWRAQKCKTRRERVVAVRKEDGGDNERERTEE